MHGLNVAAQVQESKNFLYLYSDSVIYAEKICIRYDAFDHPVLRADSRSIATGKVKFFNNEDGFFANIRKTGIFEESGFAERVEEGKINLFREVTDGPYGGDYNYNYSYDFGYTVDYRRRYQYYRRSSAESSMYFNKGYGNLQKVNYKNLMKSMTDAPECMDMLAGYRKKMTTGNILYGVAGASTYLITPETA